MKVDGDGPPSAAAAMVNVAVAVKTAEGRGSQRAVRWAIEKLLPKAHRFFLIHVMPTITAVPTPCKSSAIKDRIFNLTGESIPVNELDDSVVKMYIEDLRAKCEEIFVPFKNLYKRRSVETVVLEGDNPATVLLKYVAQAGIDSLVLGSSSPSYFGRRQKDGETELHTIKQQESSASCVPLEFHSRASSLSDFTHLNSPASLHGNTSNHISPQLRYIQNLEKSAADIQVEVGRLHLELQNTITLYNQTCEHLIHAQNKVQLLSSECREETRRVNAAKEREESLRKTAAEVKKKHVEIEKEVEIARKLLAKEACGEA
ncbi:hypothetical protein HAX54_005933 [Datura stramonium]|uniref:RING-type E3 ubiquitin transferase n=1 Tax=Datura stramonium TaxID=4076 RepID=A0ABS8TBA8_DATST|nr:hypothetical protein [Datura stramonium]